MEITFLGTGAPLHVSRAMTDMLVTVDGCPPLLIDTCDGFELARSLDSAGFKLEQIRNVIVTHRHPDHSGHRATPIRIDTS
jgi:ribonuclease BN (tRNA processing enzyme)